MNWIVTEDGRPHGLGTVRYATQRDALRAIGEIIEDKFPYDANENDADAELHSAFAAKFDIVAV